jgi:hypothetical protein
MLIIEMIMVYFWVLIIISYIFLLNNIYFLKGCSAKDLAEQNTNEQTYTALNNWDNLLPPEEEEELKEEEDLSSIPEEYLKTPPEILGKMSPVLQLLTRRLDGDGNHSYGNI